MGTLTIGEYQSIIRDKNIVITDLENQIENLKSDEVVSVETIKQEEIIIKSDVVKMLNNFEISYIHTSKSGKSTYRVVDKKKVDFILSVIRTESINGKHETNYREVVIGLKQILKIACSVEAFNGGYNRSKYFFDIYYYPIKILQALGIIEYSNRGVINLIDKKIETIKGIKN